MLEELTEYTIMIANDDISLEQAIKDANKLKARRNEILLVAEEVAKKAQEYEASLDA